MADFFYHCLTNEYNRKRTISNNQHWAVLLFEIFTEYTSFFTGTIIISQKLSKYLVKNKNNAKKNSFC